MDYKVVWSLDKDLSKALKYLTMTVEEHCSYGWKLQGGISIVTNHDNYYACQAMVKK